MYNHDLIFPFALIGLLCIVHLFLTIRKTKSEARQKQDEELLVQKQIAIQEETFQKISAEIHDNIALTLSLSKLYLHDIDPCDPGDLNDKINQSTFLIRKAIHDLNNLSKSLSSETIEQFGLVRTVEELVNDVKKAALFELKYEVDGVPGQLGSERELIIFRIIQESLNNIMRHAKAKNVSISLTFDQYCLGMEITDDGTGFITGLANGAYSGSGLNNMRKRAQALHARLFIESLPAAGTTIKLIVPVNEKQQLNAHRKLSY